MVHRALSAFSLFFSSLFVYLKMHVCEIAKHMNFISIDNLRFCCRCDDLLVGSVSPRKLQIMRLHCWPAPQLPNGEYLQKACTRRTKRRRAVLLSREFAFSFYCRCSKLAQFRQRRVYVYMCVCRRVCCVLMFIIFSVLGRHKISRYVPPRTPFCTAQFRVYIPDRRALENYKGDYCYLKKRRLLSCQPAEW